MNQQELFECFKSLAQEARELYLDSQIPVIDSPSTNSLHFIQHHVAPNKPVLIKNATRHWPALSKWTNDYLRERIGDTEVTVAVTPNGYADAALDDRFMLPHEEKMTFARFLDIIEGKVDAPGIYYVQKQNSNLTDEFSLLLTDVDLDFPWAREAFGCSPDAVNFWMGDHRAVTSLHKDHYENLYCVVQGWKDFILYPPTDLPFIPYKTYRQSMYHLVDGKEFKVVDLEAEETPWIAVDPLAPDYGLYPEYAEAKAFHVRVEAGDLLYLPSLWFHHVRQSHGCVAVNCWFDMEYGIKYNYFTFLEQLTNSYRRST